MAFNVDMICMPYMAFNVDMICMPYMAFNVDHVCLGRDLLLLIRQI